KRIKLSVSRDTAEMIQNKDIDPNVKQLILNGLLHDITSTECESTSTPPSQNFDAQNSDTVAANQEQTSCSSSESSASPSPSTSRCTSPVEQDKIDKNTFKVWREQEEKLLIDLRHKKDDEFKKIRNHSSIWATIAENMKEELSLKVTSQQCLYKYNSLKRRWKEIIDAPSGSETKYFVHKNAFDDFYGTKSTAKPSYTIDTDASGPAEEESKAETDKGKESVAESDKGKTKGKKGKKRSDMKTLIEDQHKQFLTQMSKMHEEKMCRFDQFLKLMEKKVDSQQ
ncbi:hypothetical protein FSP39_024578, partial [Pinctada imbricata]